MLPQELLRYDPESGFLFWRDDIKAVSRRRPGQRAGTLAANGYRYIKIDGKCVLEHRLAWLFTHGSYPDRDLDHINGEKSDNRIANLRLCTDSQNGGNQKIAVNNTSGFKGVYLNAKTGKWRAMVRVNYKLLRFGTYATKEEAAVAAQRAREQHFGEFARVA